MFGSESGLIVKTNEIPMAPKASDAQTNIRVAIFCIILVYQFKRWVQPAQQ